MIATADVELDELPADEWAAHIVEGMAFRHVALSPACTGYCALSGGRSSCNACGWRCSARLDDPPAAGHGCFALAALATIGAAIEAAAQAETTAITLEAKDEGEAMVKALAVLRAEYPTAEIENITIRRVPEDEDLS